MTDETYRAILEAIRPTKATNPMNIAQCVTCAFRWDDTIQTELTPVPSARCPNEYNHND